MIKSFQEFFIQFPEFKLATNSDNQEILSFFDKTAMDTEDFQIHYHRGPNFFKFLEMSSDQYYVFINSKGPISFVATITIRSGYINSKLSRIAYLGDLRSKLNQRMSLTWKKALDVLVANIQSIQEINADVILTAILAKNKKAHISLINKKNKFNYLKLCNYQMVNLITAFNPKSIYEVSFEENSQQLDDFFAIVNSKKPFGYTNDFRKKLNGRNIVVKSNNLIIGYAQLFSPVPFKEISLVRLPFLLKLFNLVLSFFTRVPKVGAKINIKYLNFLTFAPQFPQQLILESIIYFLKMNRAFIENDFIAWASFDNYPLKDNFIFKEKTELELFEVTINNLQSVNLTQAPAFEISLV